jgi:hypothetical protein
MRVSKYIKLDANILLEYVYDDANLISEPYDVLSNIKNSSKQFLSTSTSGSLNTINNQLFQIDPINRNYGIVSTTNYNFLQNNSYASGFPIRYDSIIIRLPINYTFGEHIGFYLRAYGFDNSNKKTYDLTNFYFDITDLNTKSYIDYTNPPILYQEKLWGKEITILIPSLYGLSNQLKNNTPVPNSINYTLTSGVGLSQQSPLFFEFSFINTKSVVNNITTYYLASQILSNVAQVPEYENLGVVIDNSSEGDFFEIYGVYNNSLADFNTFINNSVYVGHRYYVQYIITLYEQNIRGKSLTITVTDNFNEKIDYRPIIKYTTTTAVIEVEMFLIDRVDSSQITRKASYGMLQDQVAKYSLNLTKINLATATKPKIYNTKSLMNPISALPNTTNIEIVRVPYGVLIDKFNVSALSENALVGTTTFWGEGKLTIVIKPFDNIIKFIIAKNLTRIDKSLIPEYLDMTNFGEIKLVFKNDNLNVQFTLFVDNEDVDLSIGAVVFKVTANKVPDLKTIYNSGVNVFYITSTVAETTTSVYSGLFIIYDATKNVTTLNNDRTRLSDRFPDRTFSEVVEQNASVAPNITAVNVNTTNTIPKVITKYVKDASATTAVSSVSSAVSSALFSSTQPSAPPGNGSSVTTQVNIRPKSLRFSSDQSLFRSNTTYFFVIGSNSSLSWANVTYTTWQSTDIKNKLGLSYYPSSLTFRDISGNVIPNMGGSADVKTENVNLYSKEVNLGNLLDIITKLSS